MMGEIAEMFIEGLLDEETGEYIGDRNEQKYGTAAPGFPVSYEREARERAAGKVSCPQCGKRVKSVGLRQHTRDVHSGLRAGQ